MKDHNIGKCPSCSTDTVVQYSGDKVPSSFTCDCSQCGLLILYEDGEILDFHKELNKGCSSWPVDGSGTMYTEIGS